MLYTCALCTQPFLQCDMLRLTYPLPQSQSSTLVSSSAHETAALSDDDAGNLSASCLSKLKVHARQLKDDAITCQFEVVCRCEKRTSV